MRHESFGKVKYCVNSHDSPSECCLSLRLLCHSSELYVVVVLFAFVCVCVCWLVGCFFKKLFKSSDNLS